MPTLSDRKDNHLVLLLYRYTDAFVPCPILFVELNLMWGEKDVAFKAHMESSKTYRVTIGHCVPPIV